MMRIAPAVRQQGVSLVELMVALVISAILLLGVTDVFTSNKVTYNRINAQSRMQENARAALYNLTEQLRYTGYRSTPEELPVFVFDSPATQAVSVHAGDDPADVSDPGRFDTRSIEVQYGDDESDKDTIPNVARYADAITIRYQGSGPRTDNSKLDDGDGTVIDCQGSAVAENEFSIDTFYIRVGDAADFEGDSRFSLQCLRRRVPDPRVNPPNPQSEPLVDGLGDFQVSYGLDTDDDDSVNDYVDTFTAAQRDQIISVRFVLTVQGGRPTDRLEVATATSQSAVEGELSARNATTGQHQFVRTVSLRNLVR